MHVGALARGPCRRRCSPAAQRSRLRTAVKSLRQAVASGDAAKASEMLPETLGIIDKTAQKKVIHANTASRTKSRLSKAVAGLK